MRYFNIASSLVALAGAALLFQSPTFATHTKSLQDAKGLTLIISEQKIGGSPEEHKVTLGKSGEFRWENAKRLVVSDGKTIWSLDKAKNSYTESPADKAAITKALGGSTLLAWSAFFNPEWEKPFTGVRAGRERNLRGTAVTEVQVTTEGSAKPMTILLDSKSKVAKGAIIPGDDAETILFATKMELSAEAPAADLFAFVAPTGATKIDAAQAAAVSYADVQILLNGNCVGCHGGQFTRAGLDVSSYASLMKGGRSGSPVKAGDPDGSLLLMHMRGQRKQMPPNGRLPEPILETFSSWIKAGATNE